MAKPKVFKVFDEWKLRDLFSACKVQDGDRVCFVIPKATRGKRRRGKFCKGTLYIAYRTYCECCGPEFGAHVVDNEGKVKAAWGCDRWRLK